MEVNVSQIRKQLTEEDVLNFANINGYNLISRIREEESRLKQDYNSHQMTEQDFYKSEMIKYGRKISELILEDYGHMLDDETKTKIAKFSLSNEAILFQDDNKFKEINVDGKNMSAYAREDGKVCFPQYNRNTDIDIIQFVRKQEQSLIHEMFHIVTQHCSDRQDFIYAGVKIGKYTPGKLFNEAMAEKCARDFATKHNLIYHPMVGYIPYVRSLEKFMHKYNIQNNSLMFNKKFDEIIQIATFEEQQQYYEVERSYYLERFKKNNMIPQQNNLTHLKTSNVMSQANQQKMSQSKAKKRVRSLESSSGFINLTLIVVLIIIIITIVSVTTISLLLN